MVIGPPGDLMARARILRVQEVEPALTLRHQEEEQPVPVALLNQKHARVSDDQIMVQ